MSSRIEQIIEEIEEYVESCKYQPLSTTKIVVNKEELEELLRELRLKTPDEIKRYQKIISNKDAILADAQNKADAIIAEAQAKAREMVEQSEVMQSAYAQANETVNNANQQAQEILDAATNDANSIRLGAIGYTDDMLANLSNIMTTALNDAGEKYNSFVESLTSCYNTVVQNRSELSPQGAPEEEIDRNEACYLLTFCSSPSPAFLSSYVILTAFSGQIHPGFVFGVLYGSNFLTGFLFRLVFRRFRLHRHTAHRTHSVEKKEMSKQTSKGNLLDTSIMNGFEIITQLGGYIILFSILSGLLMDLHPFGSASPLLCGALEITTGIAQLAASSLPYAGKVSAVLTCAAFGGLSVAAQTNCMIHNSGLPLWPYLAGKLCCAAFAGTLGLFLFAFLF